MQVVRMRRSATLQHNDGMSATTEALTVQMGMFRRDPKVQGTEEELARHSTE